MAMSATKAMAMAKRSPKASGRIRGTARKTMVRTKAAGREERRVEKEASTVLWAQAWAPMLLLATESEAQYSKGSYYVTLALFLMSIPGLYSLVKRSTKSKVVRKVFEMPGPAAEGAKSLDEIARTVSNYFKNNNYKVVDAGVYYLQNANRSEKVQVKLVTSDDDMVTDMVVQGGDEEVERMTKELQLMEKGMIMSKGSWRAELPIWDIR
eukprot:jgi/Pico_ML_1/55383/g1075.t2